MISLLGSGFGLYGHLPALAELGREITVPARYRQALEDRQELRRYAPSVRFVDDEAELVSSAELLILARRPTDNENLAREVASNQAPPQLVLEKPPGPSPSAALELETLLESRGVRHAVPFLLTQCDWAHECRLLVTSGRARHITLKWHFISDKTKHSWKSIPQEGGGLLSYYVIHLIALGEFLFDGHQVRDWQTDPEDGSWSIEMAALAGPARLTTVFSAGPGESRFSLIADGALVTELPTPFGAVPRRGERDPRIDTLKEFYRSEVFSELEDASAHERRLRIIESWRLLTEE